MRKGQGEILSLCSMSSRDSIPLPLLDFAGPHLGPISSSEQSVLAIAARALMALGIPSQVGDRLMRYRSTKGDRHSNRAHDLEGVRHREAIAQCGEAKTHPSRPNVLHAASNACLTTSSATSKNPSSPRSGTNFVGRTFSSTKPYCSGMCHRHSTPAG